jgi:hypothetical protein
MPGVRHARKSACGARLHLERRCREGTMGASTILGNSAVTNAYTQSSTHQPQRIPSIIKGALN